MFCSYVNLPAWLAENEAIQNERAGQIAAAMTNNSTAEPGVSAIVASTYASARGKGARDYVTDERSEQMNTSKNSKKTYKVGEKVACNPDVVSTDVEANQNSSLYDHEVMKRRTTKPKSTFPTLQNNEPSKYNYHYQGLQYLDDSYLNHHYQTVMNKNGADQATAFMKRYSKFGSKQDVKYLNTFELKAHRWTGIPCASKSPFLCDEYPSAPYHCPSLAHFKCGPETNKQVVSVAL